MRNQQTSPHEQLEDGWQPTTPVSDTLMRQLVFNIAGEVSANAEGHGGRVERQDNLIAADLGRPAAHYNACIFTQAFESSGWKQVSPFLDDFFDVQGHSTGMVVLYSAWPTPDLRGSGWTLIGYPPAHFRTPGGDPPPSPPGVAISQVTTMEELHDWEQGAIRGYPFQNISALPAGSLIAANLLDDPRHRFWIARIDGEVAGVSSAFVEHGLCYVPLVATLPFARWRGIGTALTWRATLADPSLPAALLSSDEGRPIYERMGYLPITRWTLWYRMRHGR